MYPGVRFEPLLLYLPQESIIASKNAAAEAAWAKKEAATKAAYEKKEAAAAAAKARKDAAAAKIWEAGEVGDCEGIMPI